MDYDSSERGAISGINMVRDQVGPTPYTYTSYLLSSREAQMDDVLKSLESGFKDVINALSVLDGHVLALHELMRREFDYRRQERR